MSARPAGAAPLWRGRALALAGIVLLALNLRTAVAALSPIAGLISGDVALTNAGLGVLGMLPPVAFAVAALASPFAARRIGLERLVAAALVAAVIGHVLRAVAGSFAVLSLGSLLVFLAMGIGNVVLPPLVKKYFPDRIGMMTSLYATLNAIGMAVPPLIAYPLSAAAGWRTSLGLWAVVAFLGMIPWIAMLVRERVAVGSGGTGPSGREAGIPADPGGVVRPSSRPPVGSLWRSGTAWAIAVVFAVVSFQVYTLFAWLPEMLIEHAGVSPIAAGALLALYSALGLPIGIVVPILTERMRNVSGLIYFGAACLVLAYAGLVLLPGAAPWLWVILLRSGSVTFPACLTLINLRSRSSAGSTRLSGFVQTIGYSFAALGPLVIGLTHEATSSWIPAFVVLAAAVAAMAVAGFVLRVPRYVEDEAGAPPSRIPHEEDCHDRR